MALTVQNMIDRAGARSNLNDTSLIASAALVAMVSSVEQMVYMTAARGNPDFFGKEGNTATRTTGQTWTLTTPGNIAAVSRIEIATISGTVTGLAVGDKVNLISIRSPAELALSPRVYLRNRILYEYNSDMTATTNFVSALKIFYSYLPSRRTAVGDTLDLPDEFENLIILPLARLMAVRDQRPEEVQAIDAEFVMHWQTFLQQLSVYDEATLRELEAIPAAYFRSVEAAAGGQ